VGFAFVYSSQKVSIKQMSSQLGAIRQLVSDCSPDGPVPVTQISTIASKSLDDYPADDRTLAWLILIGVYPPRPADWPNTMREKHTAYWDLVSFVGINDWETRSFPAHYPSEDYGLKSNSLMAIIHGDIVRTGRLMNFLDHRPIPNTEPTDDADSLFFFQEHLRRLERILYVFATLNPGLHYMQGFNELLAPFYYVMNKSLATFFDNDITVVESMSFHLFQELMTKTGIAEFYTTQDKSSIILHQVREFEHTIARHLPRAWSVIQALRIHPLFYSLRWFTLLFAQEHDLPTLLMVWDSLWAHFPELVPYAFCMAVGHISAVESKLTEKNYAVTISTLQNLEITGNIREVLAFANQCWDADHQVEKPGILSSLFAIFK
jgi:hypothetical protein